MCKTALLILLTFFSCYSTASELSGILLERGTQKPLSDVNVFLLPNQLKAITDAQGKFTFTEAPDTEVQIIVNLTGYQKLTTTIQLPYQGNLNLYLEKDSYREFESVVTSSRNKRDDSNQRLSAKEFLTSAGSGGDPVKAVQNLSGVNRPTGGSAQVIIQGSEPEDTGYLIDEQVVPSVFHFGGLSSVVLPEAVSSVDFFSAGYGPENSGNLGGFVGLNTRAPKTDRRHGFFFADFINAGGMVEGPLDEKSSYLIGGRYSYISFLLAEAFKDNEMASLTVAPAFQDSVAIYQRQLEDQSNLKISFVQSDDILKFLLKKSPTGDPAARGTFFNHSQFWRLIPQWNRQLDPETEVRLAAGLGQNSFRVDIDDNFLDIKSWVLTTKGELIKNPSPLLKSFYGFDNQYQWYDVNIRIPSFSQEGGITNPIDSSNLQTVNTTGKYSLIGIYTRQEIKTQADSKLTYIPSLRIDQQRQPKEMNLQPRFTLRYEPNDFLKYSLRAGLYHQIPQPQELSEGFGNPELQSQRAQHLSLGVEKDLREGANQGSLIAGQVFYKQLDRLIIRSTDLINRGGVISYENYNNKGRGEVKGTELNYKYFATDWNLALAYTLSQSLRVSPGESWLPSEYDQTHNLNLQASLEQGKWSYSSRFRYVTGSPYTPIIGASYDSDNDVYFPNKGEIFSERKDPFTQLDFRADRQFVYDKSIWVFYVDIQNVLNTQNQESFVYSYNYKEKKSITGLPAIPSLGIKGEF